MQCEKDNAAQIGMFGALGTSMIRTIGGYRVSDLRIALRSYWIDEPDVVAIERD